MTLEQVIAVAQSQSRSAAQARNRYRASLWQYRIYRATYLPTLALQGTAPDLTRSISKLQLPDGTEAFIRQSFTSSGARLALGKTIGSTGGDVSLETALERLDLLDGGSTTTYLSTPINLAVRQPLFAFNPYRWQARIEPLRLEEARRDYAEELENIAIAAAQNFFDLLASLDQLATARANVLSTDTLLAATQTRRAAGKADEDELLQNRLASLNARLELQRAELELRARRYSFRSYLGMRDTEDVLPQIAFDAPDAKADVAIAVAQARANRASAIGDDRRLLEAKRDIAEARSMPGRSVDLYANFGLSQSTEDLGSVFNTGQEQEHATIGFRIPILDWGRSRAHLRLAESNAEVTILTVDQARQDLEQDVTRKVLEFNVQGERMRISATADTVAARRYATAERRYLAAGGDANSLNIAQFEKDSARRSHVEALRGYWIAYYELRRATRYDFAAGVVIPLSDPGE